MTPWFPDIPNSMSKNPADIQHEEHDAPGNDSASRFTGRIFWVKEPDRSERPAEFDKTAAPSSNPVGHTEVHRTASSEGLRTSAGLPGPSRSAASVKEAHAVEQPAAFAGDSEG